MHIKFNSLSINFFISLKKENKFHYLTTFYLFKRKVNETKVKT